MRIVVTSLEVVLASLLVADSLELIEEVQFYAVESLWMNDLLALGALRPERGLPVLALVLDEHVVGSDFSPAVRAQSERR